MVSAKKYNDLVEKEFLNGWNSHFCSYDDVLALKSALQRFSKMFSSETSGADWLSGNFEPNEVDALVFGLFERLVMLKKTQWHKAYQTLDIPDNIFGWVHRMKKHSFFKNHCFTKTQYMKYIGRIISGNDDLSISDLK